MKTFNPIALTRLNDANFLQFIKSILAILDKAAAALGFANITTALQADLLLMTESFKKKNLTEETKQIIALDLLRDRAFRTLKTRAESYLTDDLLPGAKAHAEQILLIMKRYGGGGITRFDLNNETATLTNLCADLQNEAADALQALNLTDLVIYLSACNTNFETRYALRGDVATELGSVPPMHKLRPGVHANYAAFVQLAESLQHFNAAEATAIGENIDRVNQEIKSFNALINNPAENPDDVQAA